MPTSRENRISSADLDFVNRSATILQLYRNEPEGSDIGLGIRAQGRLWEAGGAIVNGAGPNTSDDTNGKALVGRMGMHYGDLGIAAYGYNGDQMGTLGVVTKNRWGGDLAIGREGQMLRAEFHRAQDESAHSRGWFVQADLLLSIFSVEAYRKWAWLQKIHPRLRVESFDPDIDAIGNRQTITNLALEIRPSPSASLIAQYDWIREEDPNQQIPNNALTFQTTIKF